MNAPVQTPAERLGAISKPLLETRDKFVLSPNDWLVMCGGFEDRALAILENAATNTTPFNVLLIHYKPYVANNRVDKIRRICSENSLNLSELSYNREEPSGFGDILVEALSIIGDGQVFIDISGMSRLLIVQALVAIKNRAQGFLNCFVAYVEAQDYPPTQEEATRILAQSDSALSFSVFFLSSGVYEVTLIPELSSSAPASAHTRLIAFPSLDAHQLTALRAELQPSRLSFIEGTPPAPHNGWRRQVIASANCLDKVQNAETYQTSTLYYEETLDCLLKLYAQHGIYERLLISPTGSKMQAVAVGILRSFVEDIQIVYPTPRDFLEPERYTSGVGKMHLLALETFSENDFPDKLVTPAPAR